MLNATAFDSPIWRDLDRLTTAELEDLVGTHFTFNENAPEDFVKDFYLRQQVAQSIIDKRLGRPQVREPSGNGPDSERNQSIWATPRSTARKSE